MIRAELEPSTRAQVRPKWSSSSSDNSFCYASRARTRFFSLCRARARALLFVKWAEPEQAIPAQDQLVYTPTNFPKNQLQNLFFRFKVHIKLYFIPSTPDVIHCRTENKPTQSPRQRLLLPVIATIIQQTLPISMNSIKRTTLHTSTPYTRTEATIEEQMILTLNTKSTKTTINIFLKSPHQKTIPRSKTILNSQPVSYSSKTPKCQPKETSGRRHWISTRASDLAGFQHQFLLFKTEKSLESNRLLAS